MQEEEGRKRFEAGGAADGLSLEDGERTGRIIGAAIEVHRRLGPGFLESIYENALVIELSKRGLAVEQQVVIAVRYDGEVVGEHRLDLLVDEDIVVELKAVKDLDPVHFSVVRSYLHALGKRHGLLLNFNRTRLDVRRVIDG